MERADGYGALIADDLDVIPLTDPRCRDVEYVGSAYSTLSQASQLIPVVTPMTHIVTGTRRAWLQCGTLPGITSTPVRISASGHVVSGSAAGRPLPNSFTNITRGAIVETVLELVGPTAETDSLDDVLALSFQECVPAELTALVTVNYGATRVRVRACYGLNEELGDPVYFDEMLLHTISGHLISQRLAHKPTATSHTDVGTVTVEIAPERRDRSVLDIGRTRVLARYGLRASRQLNAAIELILRFRSDNWYLYAARALTPVRQV